MKEGKSGKVLRNRRRGAEREGNFIKFSLNKKKTEQAFMRKRFLRRDLNDRSQQHTILRL
jgi:hypothetical protein